MLLLVKYTGISRIGRCSPKVYVIINESMGEHVDIPFDPNRGAAPFIMPEMLSRANSHH